jgi:hypothetical protein
MKIIEKESKKYYKCEECGHIYKTEELANKCEAWCKENKSCNLEIVKESVILKEKIYFKQLFLGIIPFSEKELPLLASTGGWWLGKEENGVASVSGWMQNVHKKVA